MRTNPVLKTKHKTMFTAVKHESAIMLSIKKTITEYAIKSRINRTTTSPPKEFKVFFRSARIVKIKNKYGDLLFDFRDFVEDFVVEPQVKEFVF